MNDMHLTIDEKDLPSWIPHSFIETIAFKLKVVKGNQKISNENEYLGNFRMVWNIFFDRTLENLWNEIDGKDLSADFINEIIFRIPSSYQSTLYSKKHRANIKDRVKFIEQATSKLEKAKASIHVTVVKQSNISKIIRCLKLEKIAQENLLDDAWVMGKNHLNSALGFIPKSRQITEGNFYIARLCYWFKENLGRPYEKEIASILGIIFPDTDFDESNISSYSAQIREIEKSRTEEKK